MVRKRAQTPTFLPLMPADSLLVDSRPQGSSQSYKNLSQPTKEGSAQEAAETAQSSTLQTRSIRSQHLCRWRREHDSHAREDEGTSCYSLNPGAVVG